MSNNKLILGAGLVALLVRFTYFLQHVASPLFARPVLDQHYYDLCARQLAGIGGHIIDGFRPLLYPLFLSLFYSINPEGGVILSIIVQLLLGVLITVMIFTLTKKLFQSGSAGMAAGLFFALSAPPLYFEGQLLIATFFSFLLLLLWVVIFRGLEKHSGLLWLLSGIVLGLAVQARPNALPLILFFPLLTFFRWGRRRTVRPEVEDLGYTSEVGNPGYTSEGGDLGCTSEVGDLGYTSEVGDPGCTSAVKGHGHTFSPLLAIGGLLAIQILFGFVNARYSGEFSPMTQAGGINFYLGNSEKADGMIPRQDRYAVYEGEYRDPIQVMAEQGFREATGTTGALSPKAVSDHWKQKTLGQIQQNPMRWIGLMAKKSWLMLWNHEVPNNRSFEFSATQDTPLLRWLPVRWWLLLALFPWGVAALLKKGKGEQVLWITSFFILFSGTVVLFFVNSRFRIPLWPGMAVVAGGGAVYLWNSIRTGNIPKEPVVFSAILLPLSLINWFEIPPDPIENDLSMRATAYYDLGRYEDALADVKQCLEIAQNNPGYHFSHGNILMALGNNEAAIQSYLQAIGLNASDPMFHNNLGIAFENSGNFKNAEMAYRKALELRPTHRAARTNLMLLSIHEKRLEQAKEMLASLLAEEPQNSTLLCAKALIDFKETGNPKALDYARQMNPALVQQILDLE